MNRIQRKAALIVSAWSELAPDAVFGGISRAEFTQIAALGAAHAETRLAHREAKSANIAARAAADAVSGEAIQRVVWSVLGDPDFGPSSALYVAMGYEQSMLRTNLLDYGREYGEGWTPDVMLPKFWMDAARPGAVGGGIVKDRSIYGHHMTAGGPVGISQIAAMPAISLPPEAYLVNSTFVLNPAFTVAFVGRHYGIGNIRHYFDSGHIAIPLRVTLRHNGGTNNYQVVTRGIDEGDGNQQEVLTTPVQTAVVGVSPFLLTMTSNYAGSSVRVNGGRSISGGILGAEGFRGLYLGRRWTGREQYWFDGAMGELIVFSGVPSEATLAQIEGYLAWKWGIVELLPPSHPYASSKPQK